MPCDDSGSKLAAASPAAEPAGADGRVEVGRAGGARRGARSGGPARRCPTCAVRRARGVEAARSTAAPAASRSPSVRKATTRRRRRDRARVPPAVDGAPRRWSSRRRRHRRRTSRRRPSRRSPTTRRAPWRRACAARRPDASMTTACVDGRLRGGRHGRPGLAAAASSRSSKAIRSRCQPQPNGLNMKSVTTSSSLPHAAGCRGCAGDRPGRTCRARTRRRRRGRGRAARPHRCPGRAPAAGRRAAAPSVRRGRGSRRRPSRPGRHRSRRRRDRLAVPHLGVRFLAGRVPADRWLGGEPDVGLDLHDGREGAVGRARHLGDDAEIAPVLGSCCRAWPSGSPR